MWYQNYGMPDPSRFGYTPADLQSILPQDTTFHKMSAK